VKDFRQFILRGNLIDLAVAVVLGTAFAALVAAFVADFITPLIAAIFGKPNFSSLTFTVHKSTFHYGLFINALITFVLVAVVLFFFVIRPVTALMRHAGFMPAEEPPRKPCPECTTEIPEAARRCPQCTAVLVGEPGAGVSAPA
jgi:large conductance mechanosensitive channel